MISRGACSLNTDNKSKKSSKDMFPLPSRENTSQMRLLKGFSCKKRITVIRTRVERQPYSQLGQFLYNTVNWHSNANRLVLRHPLWHEIGLELPKSFMYPVRKKIRKKRSYFMDLIGYRSISFLVKKVQSYKANKISSFRIFRIKRTSKW